MIALLAAMLALVPAYMIRFPIFGFPTTLLEILIVVFLLATVIRIKIKDLNKIKKLGHLNWGIGLFVLAGIISAIYSPEKSSALGQLKAFIIEPVLVFYALVIIKPNPKQLQLVLRSLFWAAIIIATFGLFQHYSFIHLPLRFWGNGSEMMRIVSVFEYPNALSLYLAPLLGFFVALWFTDYPLTKHKWLSAVGIILMAVALLLTFSRGAWIAATVGILFILFKRFEFKKVILPLIVAAGLLLLLPGVRDRLSLGLSDPSSSAHFDLLKIGANKIAHSPIFGNGLSGFRTTQAEANYPGEILNYPHNIVLNLWLELGLLGLISFGWIVYLAFQRYKKNQNPMVLAAAVYLIILLVHGLVDVPYFKNDLSLLFWFMLSLLFI